MATLASCRPIARRRVLPAIVVLLLAVAGGTAQRPRPRIPPTGASRNVRDNLYVVAHENTRKSMEYGGTPYSRAVINVSVAFQELGKR